MDNIAKSQRNVVIVLAVLAFLAACTSGAQQSSPIYIVFFHKGSSEIAPASRQVVDRAVTAIRKNRPGAVVLASGVASGDNLELSEPRFDAVRQALIAKGIPSELISRSALPDARLDVGSAGETRVEILLLAKPIN